MPKMRKRESGTGICPALTTVFYCLVFMMDLKSTLESPAAPRPLPKVKSTRQIELPGGWNPGTSILKTSPMLLCGARLRSTGLEDRERGQKD